MTFRKNPKSSLTETLTEISDPFQLIKPASALFE